MERLIRSAAFGRLGLLAAALLIGLAFVTPSQADPIGGPNDTSCVSCQGATYVLFYSGSPVDTTATTKSYDVTLLIDTSTYTGSGTKLDTVMVKISSDLTSGVLTAAPGGISDWTTELGGLNSNGCDGSGSGSDCAMANSTGVAPNVGGDLSWTFRLEVPNSANLLDGSGEASIKARYVDNAGNKVGGLVSENITLQVCNDPDGCRPPLNVPEPATLLLLGSGLIALARGRIRR